MLQSRSRPGEKAEKEEGKEEGCEGKRKRERERTNTLTVVAFSRSLFAKILAIRGQS